MKRVLSFLLAVIMLISCCAVAAVAGEMDSSDEDEKPLYESLGVDAVTLNCKYSSDRQAVEISGNVNYNILVSYGKYSIGIIRIKPSQSIEEAINAKKPDIAAQMSIAAKFSFTLDIKKTAERFCKYAVVIISPEGQIILASEPTYIGVSSGKTNSSLNNFKGIAVNDMKEVSVGGDMGFGCAVIPVYYDRLINASMNGYMYPHEDTHLFFDKTYVDELDAKIRTFSVSGAKVYLQLLMPKVDATGAVVGYEMPDVYNEKTLSLLYTYVKFLSSRYNEYVNGQIGGFIVGKQIDKKIYNSSKVTSVEDYAEKYAFYLSVVANTARLENPDIDIIAPFSDADCFEGAVELSTGDYLSSKLIEEIAAVYDRDFSGGLDFNIMIESEGYVLETEISEDGAEKKYVPVENDRDSMLSIKELSRLNTFLQKLKKNYRSAPDKYIFSWDVPRDVQGSILECSYAYAYYSLIQNSATSSFVIS